MRRLWLCSICTTLLLETRWPIWVVARSSTPVTALWLPSCRQQQQLNAHRGFKTNWPGTKKITGNARLEFELALPRENQSSTMTIFLDAPFNCQRGSALMRRPNKSSCRARLLNCAWARTFYSKIWEKSPLKVSIGQSAPTLSYGPANRRKQRVENYCCSCSSKGLIM